MILTWYHKKQKTLLFQGNDGNLLNEELLNCCGTKTPPLHEEIANNIVSSGDRFSPVSSLNTSSKSDNWTIVKCLVVVIVEHLCKVGHERESEIDSDWFEIKNSSPSDRCDFPGLGLSSGSWRDKLNIVILKKGMDSITATSIDQSINAQHNEKIRLKSEQYEEREKNRQLEKYICVVVEGRNSEIIDLNNTIHSLEMEVTKAEEERETLKLHLTWCKTKTMH